MNKYLTVAQDACIKAGRYLKKRLNMPKHVSYKGEIDLVTDSDTGAEKIILGIIKKSFPAHNILAEESAGKYPKKRKGFWWIVDPLDGTTNFAHGYPLFAVSIALEFNGEIITAAVYNPMLDELFTAKKGAGAYLNGALIRVSCTSDISKSLLVTGFPYDIRTEPRTNLEYFNRLQVAAQDIRRDGSAALNLCYTACGRFDGFWELKLKPWDTAAGCLIAAEAGAKITDFKKRKYNIHKKEIAVSNGIIHNDILKKLAQ